MTRPSTTLNGWARHTSAPPYLAIITEPNTCDSDIQWHASVAAIEAAVSTQLVALVSIRVHKSPKNDLPSGGSCPEEFEARVHEFTSRILKLQETYAFHLVVSSSLVDTVHVTAGMGVHVKESQRCMIPDIRKKFGQDTLIGTSAHSVESALDAVSMYSPDYLFVGTCYETLSHPEKGESDLEGPSLPGQVAHAIRKKFGSAPVVLAIGGIDETNCWEPVGVFAADGVAVIRAVLQASDPAHVVRLIHHTMQKNDRNIL